ncbi:MAG TPA: 50S ribosomal protein L27 [Candidatus Paceibacterota bacterium]|nr:50S ribosomal protein L27 [Candidatus Paceibacterota bacterium]
MSHVKAAGTAKNLTDSNPQYLGVKLYDGEKAQNGSIIVRQRGTRILPGKNVKMGKDHTIFSIKSGVVKYGSTRKKGFNNKTVTKKIVSVV